LPLLSTADQLVARLIRGQPLQIMGTDPLDPKVRGLQVAAGNQQDADPLALFDANDGVAFFIQEESGYVHRQLS